MHTGTGALVGMEVLVNKVMFNEGFLLGRDTYMYKANENMTGLMKTVSMKTHSFVNPYEPHTWCKMFD